MTPLWTQHGSLKILEMLGLRISLPVNLTYCKGLRAFIFKVISADVDRSFIIVFDLSIISIVFLLLIKYSG